MSSFFQPRLSRSQTWQLFLIAAFPIHVWAILIGFWNFQTVVERSTNLMDGIAYLAYALLAALIESILLFAFLYLLSFLMPRRFTAQRIVAQLGLVATGVLLWMVLEQGLAYVEFENPGSVAGFFLQFSRPYLATIVAGLLLLGLLIFTIGLPFVWFKRQPQAAERILNIFERLYPLSTMYFVVDIFAVALVVFRNL